jgi:hypothetical protein
MEAFPRTWVLMAGPLIVLALNLLFPRSRTLKFAMLGLLGFAIMLHGFLSYVPVGRAIAHHQHYGTPVLTPFIWRVIEVGVFDVVLGSALAVLFLFLPVDFLSRILSRWRHQNA